MDEKRKTPISRREFARRAAMASASIAASASAVVSLAPADTVAAVSSSATGSANALPANPASTAGITGELFAPAPAQQPAGTPKLSPESQAEVDSRIQAIFSQYGSRFSDVQKADIRRLCAVAQPPLDRLRACALENGDGPALYMKPLVEREKKPATSQSAVSPRVASGGGTSRSVNAPGASAGSISSSPQKTPAGSAAPAFSPAPKAAPPAAKAPPSGATKKP